MAHGQVQTHATKRSDDMPSIAIIGASKNRRKFGNQAIHAFLAQGWTVYPVNSRETDIEGLPTYRSIAEVPGPVDRVSLYVPPAIGIQLLEAIRAHGSPELWINPGAGSPELVARAEQLGLTIIEACSIVAVQSESLAYVDDDP
jgi:predicted CoA-binding protein